MIRVANGERPKNPGEMILDEDWQLIQECWAHDPLGRPAIRIVLDRLSAEIDLPQQGIAKDILPDLRGYLTLENLYPDSNGRLVDIWNAALKDTGKEEVPAVT